MGNGKTNAMRILDRAGIPYKTHSYEAGDGPVDGVTVAKKLGIAPEIPVERELDLKKAARAVGEKNVEMIPVKDINKVTGYIRGGCSPIGMKKAYGTVVDCSCEALAEMLVSAGRIGWQIELAPKDLIAAAQAQTAELVRE